MGNPPFARMLMEAMSAEAENDGDEDKLSRPLQAKRLAAFAPRYATFLTQCPFSVGEFITPRKDSTYKGAGDPHLVVEVRRNATDGGAPEPDFHKTKDGSPLLGNRLDVRVACMPHNEKAIVLYWCESYQYEPWQGDIAA